MPERKRSLVILVFSFSFLFILTFTVGRAADRPQWGEAQTRNMISPETGLPADFDPAGGRNVKWSVNLGSKTYATPVVAGGKVLIGTNNDRPRDPEHRGDRGVLLCLNATDGSLAWQFVCPKLCVPGDPYRDWPGIGICSSPAVEGNRVYVLTNRNEVVCLDLAGLANGNDGPFTDEARHLTPEGRPPEKLTDTDADIIWKFDIPAQIGGFPQDEALCAVLIDGPYLYVNTSNGVGVDHQGIRNPDGPCLIVLDKATGRLVAQDGEKMARNIFHCNWSSPAVGTVGGRRLVFYGSSDDVLYTFEALTGAPAQGPVATLKRAWKLYYDPTAPKDDPHKYFGNDRESPSVIHGMPVYDQGRVYIGVGGDIWWGKEQSWLKCIDAEKGTEIWSYPLVKQTAATPAVLDGLVYTTDCGGNIHCVDARTGQACWTHKARGEFWSSVLVADGKVYAGTRRGEFVVLAAGREKKLISTARFDSEMTGSSTAADGVLYVPTMRKLYALETKK